MSKPILSIVCGTFNRIRTLQRMVNSVRNTWPHNLPREIIILDNGSTDDTEAWASAQDDVTFVQIGEPVGAIKAFTRGAKMAQGDYVVLATDDVYFPTNALVAAFAHLEQTPTCGAVAFAHNKYTADFEVMHQPGHTEHGEKRRVIYPQITMVRKWLGDVCGWWGGDHPGMQAAFTYGGDNFLGAQIVERGYAVDAVTGARDIEDVIEDAPRALNKSKHQGDFNAYMSLFPHGPLIRKTPQLPNPQQERLRVLLALHYDPKIEHHRANKTGLRQALEARAIVYDYDYCGRWTAGHNTVAEMAAIATHFDPHLILTQAHRPGRGFERENAEALRYAAPNAVLVNWNGDYWPEGYTGEKTLPMLGYYDLMLCQNAYFIEPLCHHGICAVPFPHSFEPVTPDRSQPAHDVVFAGNGYRTFREELAAFLRNLPHDVGIYGSFRNVESNGRTHYNHAATQGLYANAKAAVSVQHFAESAYGYVSNRMWEIMAAGGAVCLQQHSAGLDVVTGLKAGVHYAEWRTFDDLCDLIDHYLSHPHEAKAMARRAYDEVHRNHSFDARVDWLLSEGMAYAYSDVTAHTKRSAI